MIQVQRATRPFMGRLMTGWLIAVAVIVLSGGANQNDVALAADCQLQSFSWSGFAALHANQPSLNTSITIPPPTGDETLSVYSVAYTAYDAQSPGTTPDRASLNEPFEQLGIRIGTQDNPTLTPDLPDTTAEGAPSNHYSGLSNGSLTGWAGTQIQGGTVQLRHASLYGHTSPTSNDLIAYNLTITTDRCTTTTPTTTTTTTTTTTAATTTTSAPTTTTTAPATTTTAPVGGPQSCQLQSFSWSGFAALHANQPSLNTSITIPPPTGDETLSVYSVAYTAYDAQSPGTTPDRASLNEPFEQLGIRIGTQDNPTLTPDLPDTTAEGAPSNHYSGLSNGSLTGWAGTQIQGGTVQLRHASLYGHTSPTSNDLIAYNLTITTDRCTTTTPTTTTTTTTATTTTSAPTTTTTAPATTTTAPVGGPQSCQLQSFSWSGFAALHANQPSLNTSITIPPPTGDETLSVYSVAYTAYDAQSPGTTPDRASLNEPFEQLGIRIGTQDNPTLTPDLPDTTAEGAPSNHYSGLSNGSLTGWAGTQIQGGTVQLRHASLYDGHTSPTSNDLIAYNLTITTDRCTTTTPTTTTTTTATTTTSAPTTTTVPESGLDPDLIELQQIGNVGGALDVTGRHGTDEIYVTGKYGSIMIFQPPFGQGTQTGRLALTVPAEELGTASETGLLGLAFSADGQQAYVSLVDDNNATQIVYYPVLADGTFDVDNRRTIFTLARVDAHHVGGNLRFGPDGYLYIGLGDGGTPDNSPPPASQIDMSSLLGKMLRINPTPNEPTPYSIPTDNPYLDNPNVPDEIWSSGFRNPWRYNFDLTTGDLWIADVGQDNWEEINVAWQNDNLGKADHYGWSAYEGFTTFDPNNTIDEHTPPLAVYDHTQGCSISGGVRYRGTTIPQLTGHYLYTDFCTGKIHALHINTNNTPGTTTTFNTPTIPYASALSQDNNGNVYIVSVTSAIYVISVGS